MPRSSPDSNARRLTPRAQLFEEVLDNVPIAVGVWALPSGESDPRGLTLVAASRHADHVAGLGRRIGRTIDETVSSESLARAGPALVAAITRGLGTDLGDSDWVTPEQGRRRFRTQVFPVGGAAAFVALELPERTPEEEEAALLRAVAEATPVGLTVWRLESAADAGSFVLEFANAEASRIAGTDLTTRYGHRMDALMPDMVRSGRSARFLEIAEGTKLEDAQRVLTKGPDGGDLVLETRVYPVPGRRIGISTMRVSPAEP